LKLWGNGTKIFSELENSRDEMERFEWDLIDCRVEKQRRLLNNQNDHSRIGISQVGDGDAIQNLMSESIMLESE